MALRTRSLIWAVLLTGCEEVVTIDAIGSATVLVGVVVAGADSASIALGRTEAGSPGIPENGAELELIVDGLTVPLEPARSGACGRPVEYACYRGELGGRVKPGSAVQIRGFLASGAGLRGEAVVPGLPPISVENAGPGDTVRGLRLSDPASIPQLLVLDALPGRLGTSDTTVTAVVWAGARTLGCPVRVPGSLPGFDLGVAHGLGVSSGAPHCPSEPDLAWDSMAVPRTFLLYDEHFTAWAALPYEVEGTGSVGVQGVSGVFGAATPRTFTLIVSP